MARAVKRGATRKPVRKAKKVIAWHYIARQGVLALVLVAIIAAVWIVRQSNVLPILHVTVEGEFNHVDKVVLVDAVKPYTRGSFLSINVAKISEAGEALPWIRQVQVRRVWPDSLHLVVQEQVPVARWKNKTLVNKEGGTFTSSNKKVLAALATLDGPDASQAMMTKRYLAMNKLLQQHNLKIKTLVMDNRRAWSMALTNGIHIVLGRAESEQRFNRFLRVYQDGLQHYQSQIAEMDMRYPNGLSVIWKPGQKPDFNGTV
jgi:cell division protein FtsQ